MFEALAARDAEAKAAGVMLLPGVGFDVVPSDCLAAHMKRRLPDATRSQALHRRARRRVARHGEDDGRGHRRGHAGAAGRRVRDDGARELDTIDFGEGPKPTIGVSWGDVSTAYHSTKIPNIEVHFEVGAADWQRRSACRASSSRSWAWPFVQSLIKAQIDRMPEGPTDEQRRAGRGGADRRRHQRQGRARAHAADDRRRLYADGVYRARDRAPGRQRRIQARVPDAEPRLSAPISSSASTCAARGVERVKRFARALPLSAVIPAKAGTQTSSAEESFVVEPVINVGARFGLGPRLRGDDKWRIGAGTTNDCCLVAD